MRKISDTIESLVLTQPFLEEALMHGYLNLTSFAEYIRPYIEQETQKTTSIHAIKMALSRLQMHPSGREFSLQKHVFKKTSTRLGLSLMTLTRSPRSQESVMRYMQERSGRETFFTMIEGLHEIDLIYETGDHDDVCGTILSEYQIMHTSGLGLISCTLSDREISTPGLFYAVTKRFAFHGINILQILSTYHEFGVLIREDDVRAGVGLFLI